MVMSGLGSFSDSVQTAGTYQVQGSLTLPGISKGDVANSQVVTVVQQNGSTRYTGLAGAEGFNITLVCAAGDVIGIILSSSAAVDQGINVVKATIAIG